MKWVLTAVVSFTVELFLIYSSLKLVLGDRVKKSSRSFGIDQCHTTFIWPEKVHPCHGCL